MIRLRRGLKRGCGLSAGGEEKSKCDKNLPECLMHLVVAF